MTAINAAKLYNALRLHFNTDYDYFKYNGKTKTKFIDNNRLYVFEKLDKLYTDKIKDFYIANFVVDTKIYPNNLLSDTSSDIYMNWMRRKENLTYIYKNDIQNVIQDTESFNDLLEVKGSFPILLRKTLQGKITIETLLIMNSVLKFFPVWDKKINDDIIWDSFKFRCRKYYPFIEFDKGKMKQILKDEVLKWYK